MAFPVVPVDTLPERKCHFFFELSGSKETFRKNGGQRSTSGVSQNERHFSQSARQSRDADVVTEELREEITPAVSPALISINREALLLFSLTAAGSRCGSAAPPPSAYL